MQILSWTYFVLHIISFPHNLCLVRQNNAQLRTDILTSVWSAQHPKAGLNIQQATQTLQEKINLSKISMKKETIYFYDTSQANPSMVRSCSQ